MIFKLSPKVEVEHYPHQCDDSPLVSVVVVAFNHEKYIERCLDSILGQQTNFKYEIVLGEDQSPDSTREICKNYADKYPDRIKLFLHSRENNIKINGHPTGRFNFLFGLNNANGKYIALCDGDDHWTDPLKLQKQIDFLESNPDYIICGAKWKVQRNGKQSAPSFLKNSTRTILEPQDFITVVNPQLHSSTLVFKNVLSENESLKKDIENMPVGDIPIYFLLALEGKVNRLDDYVSIYNKENESSLTHSRPYRDIAERLVYMLDELNKISKGRFNKIFEREKRYINLKVLLDENSLNKWQRLLFIIGFRDKFEYSVRDILYLMRTFKW